MTIFNQKQKDALAKVFDNIGVLNTGAIIMGVFINNNVTLVNGLILGTFSVVLFGFAILLRGDNE